MINNLCLCRCIQTILSEVSISDLPSHSVNIWSDLQSYGVKVWSDLPSKSLKVLKIHCHTCPYHTLRGRSGLAWELTHDGSRPKWRPTITHDVPRSRASLYRSKWPCLKRHDEKEWNTFNTSEGGSRFAFPEGMQCQPKRNPYPWNRWPRRVRTRDDATSGGNVLRRWRSG